MFEKLHDRRPTLLIPQIRRDQPRVEQLRSRDLRHIDPSPDEFDKQAKSERTSQRFLQTLRYQGGVDPQLLEKTVDALTRWKAKLDRLGAQALKPAIMGRFEGPGRDNDVDGGAIQEPPVAREAVGDAQQKLHSL